MMRTAGLLVFVTVVAVTFWLAARATGGVDRAARRQLPGLMAHSLIPIVLGYVFAHYLSYLVEQGQQAVIDLADPFGRGWNVLGLGGAEVNYVLSLHPSVLATIKVCCVVGGHVAGVDRRTRPRGTRVAGRIPADGSVGDDAGDGRLHVHRSVSAIRRMTKFWNVTSLVAASLTLARCRATTPLS